MLVAIGFANAVNYGLTHIVGYLPFSTQSLSVSVFFVFTGLLWAFNNHLWRWPLISRLAGVPDISGTWVGPLASSYNTKNNNGQMRPEFTIQQTWTRVEINADFPSSRSESISASFITDQSRQQLVFAYRNYPRDSSSNRGTYGGTNFLRYMTDSEDNELLQGEYYTDQTRNNHGTVELRRREDVDESDDFVDRQSTLAV